MKATIIMILWAATFLLQLPSSAQNEAPTNTQAIASIAVSGHLITLTADYRTNAISIFYPDRTELIYVKVRKGHWVDKNKYNEVSYDVVYQDGTRKYFENVKLFREEDVMQRVVTDHLSKITELGYELISTNMTDFNKEKYLTAFFRFKG